MIYVFDVEVPSRFLYSEQNSPCVSCIRRRPARAFSVFGAEPALCFLYFFRPPHDFYIREVSDLTFSTLSSSVPVRRGPAGEGPQARARRRGPAGEGPQARARRQGPAGEPTLKKKWWANHNEMRATGGQDPIKIQCLGGLGA